MISLTCSEKKLFCLEFNFILFCGKKFFILEKQKNMRKTISFQPLKIMLDVNKEKTATATAAAAAQTATSSTTAQTTTTEPTSSTIEFTFDMLEYQKGETPTTSRIIITETQPLYTNTIRYPERYIRSLPRPLAIEFFFNKTKFQKILLDKGTHRVNLVELSKLTSSAATATRAAGTTPNTTTTTNKDEEANNKKREKYKNDLRHNEETNIMLTLQILFPVHQKLRGVLQSSYHEFVMEESNPYLWTDFDVLEAMNFFGWMDKTRLLDPERGSSIKIGGRNKIIKEVIWTNDLINHRQYRKFMTDFNGQMATIEDKEADISDNEDRAKTELRRLFTLFQLGPNENTNIYENYKFLNDLKFKNQVSEYFKTKKNVMLSVNNTEIQSPHLFITYLKRLPEEDLSAILEKAYPDKSIPPIVQSTLKSKNIQDFIYDLQSIAYPKQSSSSRGVPAPIINGVNTIVEILNDLKKFVGNNNNNNNLDMSTIATRLGDIDMARETANKEIKDSSSLIVYDKYEAIMRDMLAQAAIVKAAERCHDFVRKKTIINMSNTLLDGKTPKPAFEQSINAALEKNFLSIKKASEKMESAILLVYPNRRTSNTDLFSLLDRTRRGDWAKKPNGYSDAQWAADKHAFETLYSKYSAADVQDVDDSLVLKYMYTGVDTVVTTTSSSAAAAAANPVSDTNSHREIYVSMTVLDKEAYLSSEDGTCSERQDDLLNKGLFLANAPNRNTRDYLKYYPRMYDLFSYVSKGNNNNNNKVTKKSNGGAGSYHKRKTFRR